MKGPGGVNNHNVIILLCRKFNNAKAERTSLFVSVLSPQRQNLLSHDALSTERTLWLLGNPIMDTGPAEDVAARGGRGGLHGFETECAFALLVGFDPFQVDRVFQIDL